MSLVPAGRDRERSRLRAETSELPSYKQPQFMAMMSERIRVAPAAINGRSGFCGRPARG